MLYISVNFHFTNSLQTVDNRKKSDIINKISTPYRIYRIPHLCPVCLSATCCAVALINAACSRLVFAAEVPAAAAAAAALPPKIGEDGVVESGLARLQENDEGGLS